MKRIEKLIPLVVFASDVMPKVTTESERDATVIEWGDANPVAWKIVTQHKSKAFGKNATIHMGWSRGADHPAAIIDRLGTFMRDATNEPAARLHHWRARFTLEHYADKGFKGGYFEQFDGATVRGCLDLDYTPETRDEVIERFLAWCDTTMRFPTREVRIDGKVIRKLYPEARA